METKRRMFAGWQEGLLDVDEFRGVRKNLDRLARGPKLTMEGFMNAVWEESIKKGEMVLSDEVLGGVRELVNAGSAEQKFMGLYGMCLSLRPRFSDDEEKKVWMEEKGDVYKETAEKVLGFVWGELKGFDWPKEMSPGLQKFYAKEAEERVTVFATTEAWTKAQADGLKGFMNYMKVSVGLEGEKVRKKSKEIPEMQAWESSFYYTLKEVMSRGLLLGGDSEIMSGIWPEISEAILLFKSTVEEKGSVVRSMKDRDVLRARLWKDDRARLAIGRWGCEAVRSLLRNEIKNEDDELLLRESLGERAYGPLNVPLLKIVRRK
jgi:hypothetical protein